MKKTLEDADKGGPRGKGVWKMTEKILLKFTSFSNAVLMCSTLNANLKERT